MRAEGEMLLKKMLFSEMIKSIEDQIGSETNARYYWNEILLKFLEEEISESQKDQNEVVNFIDNNRDRIIRFAIICLSSERAEVLSRGIAFTYGIYLMYLDANEDLLGYINRRRIKNPKATLRWLKSSYAKLKKECV